MLLKIGLVFVTLVAVFLVYVATREGEFRYERSGVINASPENIFPYISNLRMGGLWSPYEKKDLNMKKIFTGEDGQVGSALDFDGSADAGSGKLEILKVVPNEAVKIRLLMTKPIAAENLVEYTLTPEGSGTRFTWVMSGDGGFLGKLVNIFIDCEKMVADDFVVGIENLKTLIEAQK